MTTISLFDLPDHVLAIVLTKWLGFLHMRNLDAALCCHTTRASYLSVLQFEGTVFHTLGPRFSRQQVAQLDWATKRSINVRFFEIFGKANVQKTVSFVHCSSRSIERLTLGHVDTAVFQALHPHLRFARLKHADIFVCGDSCGREYANFLAVCSATLETLAYYNAVPTAIVPVPHCEMIKLHSLRLCNLHVGDDAGGELVAKCPNLTRVVIQSVNRQYTVFHSVAAHCPHLQQLYCQFGDANSAPPELEALGQVLQRCVYLVTLEVFHLTSNHVTEDQIVEFARHCSGLVTFRATVLQGQCLTHLLAGMPLLQHLVLGAVAAFPAILRTLTVHCSRLKSLSLDTRSPFPVDSAELNAMCSALTLVQDLCLTLHGLHWMNDRLLTTIGRHCKCLRSICISSASLEEACFLTMTGSTALLRGCPALREVYIQGTGGFTDQLRALRPDVTFRVQTFQYYVSERCADATRTLGAEET